MATPAPKPTRFERPPAEDYAGLVAALPPRPLHDRYAYDAAVVMIGRLAGYDLNEDQADYLEALAILVERYEAEHDETRLDTGRVSGLDALRSLMDSHGMSGADLSRLLGISPSLGPMILRGERNPIA